MTALDADRPAPNAVGLPTADLDLYADAADIVRRLDALDEAALDAFLAALDQAQADAVLGALHCVLAVDRALLK